MFIKEPIFENSEAIYRLIVQNMMDMVRIISVDGTCVYASPSHKDILGYTHEQYIEQQIFHKIVHSKDVPMVNRAFQELLSTKQPRSLQFRVIHADGRQLYVEEHGKPVLDEHGEIGYIVFVSRDVTEQVRMERALKESEVKYRSIAENMADLLGVVDSNGTILYASPSYKTVLGLDAQGLVGTSAYDYVHPDDLLYIQNKFEELARTKVSGQERLRFVHANGASVDVDCLGTPVLDEDGELESIVLVARDITENVRMEKEINESEERYRRLIELSPHAMVSHRNEIFIYANPAAVRLFGAKSASELVGKRIDDIFHPDYAVIARKRADMVVKKKYVSPLQYKFLRLDGQIIEAEGTGIYDDQTKSTLSVFNDITERKKMERALVESEERYRRLVQLSSVAIGIYSDNKFIYINPAGVKVLGAAGEEDIKGSTLADWLHSDDYHEVTAKIARSFLHEGNRCQVECKVIRMDGGAVDISATFIYDPESSSIQLMFEDITARKQAERALSESEELNRRLIELSPQAIVFHLDYKYHYVNPAGVALFGASDLSDLIGRSIFELIHPDYQEETKARLAEVYLQERSDTPMVEQQFVRLDGGVIDIEVLATPIPYKGQTAGLTLIRDITDRKKSEEVRKFAVQTMRESEDRYFRLQTSLDRFSHGLFGDMKISEMEGRLVRVVQVVMETPNVSLIQVNHDRTLFAKIGNLQDIPKSLLADIMSSNLNKLGLCEINSTPGGCFLKIGQIKGDSYILCIGGRAGALQLTPIRVWLKTITRYVCVLYDSFRLIEDLTKELERATIDKASPAWMLRLLFNLSENERKRLSQDLHDAALQEQIIWYRKLEQLCNHDSIPMELRKQLEEITEGLLDVIYQIRITCNELMPPMLKQEGLVSSLEVLFEFTQIRTDYSIQFNSAGFDDSLNDNQLIGIYRIVQELLANATKHSDATQVSISLSCLENQIHLTYEDNGVGMDVNVLSGQSFNQMGLYGMTERVRSMDGIMEIRSSLNHGLAVVISIPVS